jgi:orotate phosphoribosyltransferase
MSTRGGLVDVWGSLRTGGLQVIESDGEGERRPTISKYDPLLDPRGAETLAHALATEAQALGPTRVLLWQDDVTDLVLGHIVTLNLGLTWIRAVEADGLVDLLGELSPGDRVLLLADAFRDPGVVRALITTVEVRGAEVRGIAVFVETPELRSEFGVPVVSLVRIDGPVEETRG